MLHAISAIIRRLSFYPTKLFTMKKCFSFGVLLGLWLPAAIAAKPAPAPAKVQAASEVQAASAPQAPLSLSATQSAPHIQAAAYAVYDAQSHQVLAEKNFALPIEPASLTHLMVAYLAFKALDAQTITPKQEWTVSENAWKSAGNRMFLERGGKANTIDLLHGMLILSGNDAALTLAEGMAGSESAFVAQMNAEAERLGMRQTHFENVTGLHSPKHVSSVQDLLILSQALLRDFPDYYQIFAKKTFTYNKITQPNHNLLLFRNDDVDGLKTGYSDVAGYHLITGSHRNGRRIFSIVIGASSNEARAIESRKLLNYALEAFDTQKIYAANTKITDLPVLDGSHTRIEAGTAQDVYLTFPRHSPQPPEIKISVPNVAHAPVQKGQTLGMLQVYAGGKLLTEQPLMALDDMPSAGFFGRLWSYVWYWWKS